MATKDERMKALKELHEKCKAACEECEAQMKALEDGDGGGGTTKGVLAGCKTIQDAAKALADAGNIRAGIMATRMDPRTAGEA
jgi:hypothetical protein